MVPKRIGSTDAGYYDAFPAPNEYRESLESVETVNQSGPVAVGLHNHTHSEQVSEATT